LRKILDFPLKKISLLCTIHTVRDRKSCLTSNERYGEICTTVPVLHIDLSICRVRTRAGECHPNSQLTLEYYFCYLGFPRSCAN